MMQLPTLQKFRSSLLWLMPQLIFHSDHWLVNLLSVQPICRERRLVIRQLMLWLVSSRLPS